MSDLVQDIKLVSKGLASSEFAADLNERLRNACDGDDSIALLKVVGCMDWS
jgi:hypothetical protein